MGRNVITFYSPKRAKLTAKVKKNQTETEIKTKGADLGNKQILSKR